MDKNRLWVIGAVLVIGAIVVLGWVLGISPKLTEVRTAQADRETTVAQNAVYEAQIETLKKQFEGIDALKDDLSDIQRAVPMAAEIPSFVAELNAVAETSQVAITGFTQNDAQAYDPALLVVAEPIDTEPSEPSEPSPTPTPAPSSGTDTAEVPAVGGVDPRITPTNFVAIPISITVGAPYTNVLDFISGIQHGSRLVMVNAVSTSVPALDGTVTGTITALVYVLLDPDAAASSSPR